ncbi:MAG: substrate-binding domain-containing protein [Cellvibrionaceae bacterium]|nr:substrate-binding domain-containing protein [Cellvibrionaceae bacterium]
MEFDSLPARTPGTLTIGVYTPYLQGFYIGELVNQIRQLCFVKGYRLVVIRTGGLGKFQSALQLDQIDCAIFIRNAVSAEFVEKLRSSGKPCVAIAYDYFPLAVPVVSSDNQFGIGLAMGHLLKAGHNKIAFVGDLSLYDLRKRYEYYCEAHDQYQLPLNEQYLFTISDAQCNSGHQTAQQFIDRKCDATGIIFGAGLTGIAFLQHIRQVRPDLSTRLQGVCFDALSLIPVFTPELTSVDQNLNLIAYRAINVLEAQVARQEVPHHIQVEPKLTYLTEKSDAGFTFIATCIDLPELHNSNYMKALMANMHEWPREIVASGLDQIMCIAPLFERFMDMVFLSRHFIDNNQRAWIKQIKTFLAEGVVKTDLSDSSSLCHEEKFPPASVRKILHPKYDFQLHMPIQVNGKLWGFLSTLGHTAAPTAAASFFGFGGYIETIVRLFEQDLEIKTLQKKSPARLPAQARKSHPTGTQSLPGASRKVSLCGRKRRCKSSAFNPPWNSTSTATWILPTAFTKMTCCAFAIRFPSAETIKTAFTLSCATKMKTGQFSDATLQAEPVLDNEQKMTGMRFYLGVNHVL